MKKYFLIPLVCWVICGTGAGAVELGDVAIHGFISQGYLQSDKYDFLSTKTEEGSFEMNEMGLNFTNQVTDRLRIGAQFFAMDFGDYGNDEISIDWACGDYRWTNMLGVRAGKFKLFHGLYNDSRDFDMLRTAVFLPMSIYDPASRATFSGINGAEIYGSLPWGFSYVAGGGITTPSERVSEQLVNSFIRENSAKFALQVRNGVIQKIVESIRAANPAVDTATARALAETRTASAANYISNTVVSYSDINTDRKNAKNLALRWSPSFASGLRLSTTYFAAESQINFHMTVDASKAEPLAKANTVPISIKEDEVSAMVYSLEYVRNNLTLAGEYNRLKVDFRNAGTVNAEGWAATAGYRFADWFELGGYYSDYCTNTDDRGGDKLKAINTPAAVRWLRDACLTTRFDINENWLFKVEGHAMRGLNSVDWKNEPNPGEGWYLFAAKATYNF